MAVILVGAMIVAGIETVWSGQVTPKSRSPIDIDYTKEIKLAKGEEMGRFKLGSTVIVLFPPKTIRWLEDMTARKPLRMGEGIGELSR